jgi:hypothetical protein
MSDLSLRKTTRLCFYRLRSLEKLQICFFYVTMRCVPSRRFIYFFSRSFNIWKGRGGDPFFNLTLRRFVSCLRPRTAAYRLDKSLAPGVNKKYKKSNTRLPPMQVLSDIRY